MPSLLFTDFDALNRDAETLQKRLSACTAAMKKACGADTALYRSALEELSHGEFTRKGGKLRLVAEEAGVLAQVAEILPMMKSIELRRKQPYDHNLDVESLGGKRETIRMFLLEARLREALNATLFVTQKDGRKVPLGFEDALRNEQKRRACFLEACTDMVRHAGPGQPFDTKQLHTGAALAHHRVLTNQPVLLPYFAEKGSHVQGMQDPWFLGQLDAKIAGYNTGFGFARKTLKAAHKSHDADRQDRDYWVPAISIDTRIYESLMKLRKASPELRAAVDGTLGAIQKFFMLSGHDYLHHAMYTIMPQDNRRNNGMGAWNDFEGPDSLYREAGSPPPLTDHLNQYRTINPGSGTHNEYVSLVMHHRILRHLFNAETIDGKDNARGRNIKEAFIKAGEAFPANLSMLRAAFGKHGASGKEAQDMTECLAMMGLSQLALAIDMDDKDMKRVYAAFEEHKIFGDYKIPAKWLTRSLSYFSGHYHAPPAQGITRGYLESAEPTPNNRYRVEALKKWVADLKPDDPVSRVTLTGEDGLRARILTKPWGEVVGWLNEPELGHDFCPRIAHSYYDAFMTPEIIETKSFKSAAEHFGRATGLDSGFTCR